MSNLVNLKFELVSFTSEDTSFPTSELLKHGPQSKGWQSARFQDYPQMLIFRYPVPVHIKQLQVLSHQSKISSKIEIFTYIPENPSKQPPLDQFKWKRLGYLSLDNNEKSNYQARELKSVFIDTKASYLKLCLYKCHPNKHNMFNQVGLIALNTLGTELSDLIAYGKKVSLELDPQASERIKVLMGAKERAIANEDFDEAKKIRETIDRVQQMTQQLFILEERKKVAVNNEDYDSAKVLKIEIERIKNALFGGDNRPNTALGMVRPASKGGYNKPDYEPPVVLKIPRENAEPQIMSRRNYEEQIIPANKNNVRKFDVDERTDDMIKPSSPEPLNSAQSQQAEPFLHILTEYLCKRIFSRTWQFREEGLDEIQTELKQGEDSQIFQDLHPQQVYFGVLGAIKYTIADKVSQVSIKSMNLLGVLVKNLTPSKSFLRGEIIEFIQTILGVLLEKIGDSNNRVKDLAESSFLVLSKSELVGVEQAVKCILRPGKEKNISLKQMQGRVSLLAAFVSEFRIDNPLVPLNPVVDFGIQAFLSPNPDLKSVGTTLLTQIFGCIGTRLTQILSESRLLKPGQLDSLLSRFSEIEISNYQDSRPLASNRKTPQKESFCRFCGKHDELFTDPDRLDIHYWKDCPMLVACLQCSQIVEILHLNSHLLRECELKDLIGQCTRCKEAINMDEFENHLEENACLPAKHPSKANRCPLCHDDVDPGQSGWLKHILSEGCPNNDRNL